MAIWTHLTTDPLPTTHISLKIYVPKKKIIRIKKSCYYIIPYRLKKNSVKLQFTNIYDIEIRHSNPRLIFTFVEKGYFLAPAEGSIHRVLNTIG